MTANSVDASQNQGALDAYAQQQAAAAQQQQPAAANQQPTADGSQLPTGGANDAAEGAAQGPGAGLLTGKGKWLGLAGLAALAGGTFLLSKKIGAAGGLAQLGMKGAFMPASMAMGGAGMAYMGFTQSGVESGVVSGAQQTEAIALPIIEQLTATNNQQGAILEQLAAAGRISEGDFQADPTTGLPTFVGEQGIPGGTNTGDTGQGGPSLTPGTAGDNAGTGTGAANPGTTDIGDSDSIGGTGDTNVVNSTAPVIPAGQWTAQKLIGQSVVVQDATTTDGYQVAAGGSAAITNVVGDPAGYGSYDQAMRAGLNVLNSDLELVNYKRAVVLEHEGRYYAFAAVLGTDGQPMPDENGTVAGWSAITYVNVGSQGAWAATQWNRTAGLSVQPMGAGPVSGAAVQIEPLQAGATTTPATTESSPLPNDGTNVTGSGAPATAFDARAALTSGFSIGNAEINGVEINGGSIQLQSLLNETGFATDAEAVAAARAARSADTDVSRWDRWIVSQGGDGQWYAYGGSIVSADVPSMPGDARPAYILGYDEVGQGISEYFDGQHWQAVHG